MAATVSVDWPDYQTPQAHATAISITGAPLLNLSGKLDQNTFTLATNGSNTSLTVSLNQPGYEIEVNAQYTAAGALGNITRVRLTWTDQATGLTLDSADNEFVPGSSAGPAHIVTIRGLTKANQLTVTFLNTDSVSTVTLSYAIFQHSRVVPRDYMKTLQTPGIPTALSAQFAASFGRPQSNVVLDFFNASVAGGATVNGFCSVYSGQVAFFWGNGSSTNAITAQVFDINDSPGTSSPIFQGQQDSNGNGFALINLPRNQCFFRAIMTGATAHAVWAKMVATETQN